MFVFDNNSNYCFKKFKLLSKLSGLLAANSRVDDLNTSQSILQANKISFWERMI